MEITIDFVKECVNTVIDAKLKVNHRYRIDFSENKSKFKVYNTLFELLKSHGILSYEIYGYCVVFTFNVAPSILSGEFIIQCIEYVYDAATPVYKYTIIDCTIQPVRVIGEFEDCSEVQFKKGVKFVSNKYLFESPDSLLDHLKNNIGNED